MIMNSFNFNLVAFLAICLITVWAQNCPKNQKVVICYWASWAVYRPNKAAHRIELIHPEYCTHLVYSFAGINLNGVIDSLDYYNDITQGNYKKFTEIKQTYPCIKTLLAIGGWNEGSEKYSLMADTEESRENFVNSVLRYIIHFDFDGFDIDWEYPGDRGGLPDDKINFSKLLELLNQKLSRRNKILTGAVAASTWTTKNAYDIPSICEYLDFVNIMGYDMHYTDKTSAHAPLKREATEASARETLEVVIDYYIKNGCPKEKIVLGIPSFGRSYTLKNEATSGLGAAVTGVGNPGNLTQSAGFMGFNEICESITIKNNWKIYHLKQNAVKYAVLNNQWISYDDPETVAQKAEYVKQKQLAGVMFWSIDTDDFHGDCYFQSYPLLAAANKALGNKI